MNDKKLVTILVQVIILHSLMRNLDPVQLATDKGFSEKLIQDIKKARDIAGYIVSSIDS